MEQVLPDSRNDALLPIMKALITDALFRSEHEEVAASVASCLAVLMRISAPDAPYDDNIMEVYILIFYSIYIFRCQNLRHGLVAFLFSSFNLQEIFQLMGQIFTKLSQPSGHCYEKAASTLFTVARVKACLLMLDLELHSLIIELFNTFLLTIE